MRIPFVGFGPIVDDSLAGVSVVTDLEGNVGMGVSVISISSFVFVVEGDKDFFVEPGLGGYSPLFVAFELEVLFLFLIEGGLLVILHDESNDFVGPVFHPLDIKIDFGANLVFGKAVFLGGIGVTIMDGAAMATSDDDPLAGLLLQVVKEVGEDGVDALFTAQNGEAVAGAPFTIGQGGIAYAHKGGIQRCPFTAKEFFGNSREVGVRLPWVGGAGCMDGGANRVKVVVAIAVHVLASCIAAAQLFPLRALHTGTTGKEKAH